MVQIFCKSCPILWKVLAILYILCKFWSCRYLQKKGEIKKFLFIYLLPMALHEFWIFVCLPKSDLRPPGARFNKFINFSARWLSKRSLLKTFRWTFLWEGTYRDMVFLVNFLANFPLRVSCQVINFYPLHCRCGNHFGVCSVNVEMILRTSITAEINSP